MTKNEFMKKLKRRIAALPRAERNKALDYYSELIDERIEAGFTEEAATAEIGDVKAAAESVIAEAKERGVKMRMTGGWWIAGLICGVACGVGLLFLISHLITNWDDKVAPLFDRAGGEWVESNTAYALDDVKGIYAELKDADLFVGVSEDDMVHVTYYENKVTEYELGITEKGLELKQKSSFRISALFWKKQRQTVILVPTAFSGEIKCGMQSGELRADNLQTEGMIVLSSASGDIIVYDTSARGIDVSVGAGKIIIGRCSAKEDVAAVSSSGSVEIEHTAAGSENGTISVTSATGDIKLTECTAHTVKTSVSTGAIMLKSVKAESAEAKAVMGAVTVDMLDAKTAVLSSGTGAVTGKLAGSKAEYTISTSAALGSNNLGSASGSGDRRLEVSVGTGEISISFEQG